MTAAALGHIDTVRAVVPPGRRGVDGTVRRGDPLLIRGWAVDAAARAPFDAVEAVFADGTVAPGIAGIERTDVAAHLGSQSAMTAGFLIVAPTDTVVAGPQEVTIRARRHDASCEQIGIVAIDVRAGARARNAAPGAASPYVHVDDVRTDRTGLVPMIDVHGWALQDESLLPGGGVVITIGDLAVEAVYGYPRPDVVAALSLGSASEQCGFRARIACDEIEADGAVTSALRAHLDVEGGARWSGAAVALPPDVYGTVALPQSAARGRIESIHVTDAAGRLRVSSAAIELHAGEHAILTGWAAFEGTGELVALADGQLRLPAAERTAAGGFVVSIATTDLTPGYHTIELFVRDESRRLHPTGAHATIAVR